MPELFSQVQEAAAMIADFCPSPPQAGIVLGTGMGPLADEIESAVSIAYEEIPHFPTATALGHSGHLVCGLLGGASVVAMSGRFHAYEGCSLRGATLPVRVMKALGCEMLFLSNAAGGLNPRFRAGEIVMLDDHINLIGDNPLIGVNDPRLGPRFPDMSQPYDPQLIEAALSIARGHDIIAHRGVYVAMPGPNYETRAEYRFLRTIGGDVVGMSTVPEVLVAVHCGLSVLACSVVSNVCNPDELTPTSGEEVLHTAQGAQDRLRTILKETLRQRFRRRAPAASRVSCEVATAAGSTSSGVGQRRAAR